jgi:hypothetical protein
MTPSSKREAVRFVGELLSKSETRRHMIKREPRTHHAQADWSTARILSESVLSVRVEHFDPTGEPIRTSLLLLDRTEEGRWFWRWPTYEYVVAFTDEGVMKELRNVDGINFFKQAKEPIDGT